MEHFKILGATGAGGFATVYIARHRKSRSLVAIRIQTKNVGTASRPSGTVRNMAWASRHLYRIPHTCFPKRIWYEGGKCCAMMPFYHGSAAALHPQLTTRDDRRYVIAGAAAALRNLHTLGVIHRDVKPENILLRDVAGVGREVALCDPEFLTRVWPPSVEVTRTVCGTVDALAPETEAHQKVSTAADMWALGICTLMLLDDALVGPYGTMESDEVRACIKGGASRARDWAKAHLRDDADALDFVLRCLRADRTERLTAAEALQHPFLRDVVVARRR